MSIINNIKAIFWFSIMVFDMICVVSFSIKVVNDFSVFNIFILSCFIVSGLLAVSICKNTIINTKKAIQRRNMGIVSIHQLKSRV